MTLCPVHHLVTPHTYPFQNYFKRNKNSKLDNSLNNNNFVLAYRIYACLSNPPFLNYLVTPRLGTTD